MQLLSGLMVVFLVALSVWVAVPAGIGPLNPVLLVILLGIAARSIWGLSPKLVPGVNYAVKSLLKLAIILLGVRFHFGDLWRVGSTGLLLILVSMTTAGLVVWAFSRTVQLSKRLSILIAIGSAICGNSAVMAAAPLIEAEDEEITMAVSTITFLGTVAVFLYPLIGRLLGLTAVEFGLWSGTAIHDTSQVVAASFSFSEQAGETATVIKITRNLMMVPTLFLIGMAFTPRGGRSQKVALKAVPWFMLGFLALATVNSLGLIGVTLRSHIQQLSLFLIYMVLAAVGLKTDVRTLAKIGGPALLMGLLVSTGVAAISLLLIQALR